MCDIVDWDGDGYAAGILGVYCLVRSCGWGLAQVSLLVQLLFVFSAWSLYWWV